MRVGMSLLPLPPQPIDVGVHRPEDRVVGRRQVAEHVAERRLAVEVVALVEFAAGDLHRLVAVLRYGHLSLPRGRCRWLVGVHAAGPDVHGVVRILIEEAERVVVEAAAAEIAEGAQAQDLLDVVGGRVVIMDLLVDGCCPRTRRDSAADTTASWRRAARR